MKNESVVWEGESEIGRKKVRMAKRNTIWKKREDAWQGEGKARGRTEVKRTGEILFVTHQGHKPMKIT